MGHALADFAYKRSCEELKVFKGFLSNIGLKVGHALADFAYKRSCEELKGFNRFSM